MSRDERQAACMRKWIASNGHASIEASTGFGKTRIATNVIKWLQSRHPEIRIIIVVPTSALQEQ